MKRVIWAFSWLLGVAGATPNGFLVVTEQLLGGGNDGFAVMRFEKLNRGSDYDWEERTYLDEYRMGKKGRELAKSSLLLEVKCSFPDADTSRPLQRTMVTQDQKVKLGEVIRKYPLMNERSWEGREWLVVDQGWLYFEKVRWLRSREDLAKIFVDGLWIDGEVEEVRRAPGGGLFVQLSNKKSDEGDGSYQIRQIYLPDVVRREMVDHQNKLGTYLMVGEFESLEEAQALAARIEEISRTRKIPRIQPQVWTRRHSNPTRYRVVAGVSEQALGNEKYQSWKETFGVDVLAVKGASLFRRIYRD